MVAELMVSDFMVSDLQAMTTRAQGPSGRKLTKVDINLHAQRNSGHWNPGCSRLLQAIPTSNHPQGNRVLNAGGLGTRHSRAGGNPNPRLPSHPEPSPQNPSKHCQFHRHLYPCPICVPRNKTRLPCNHPPLAGMLQDVTKGYTPTREGGYRSPSLGILPQPAQCRAIAF